MKRTMNEYCTKVNRDQWDSLVTICDELGIKIQKHFTINPSSHYTYVKYYDDAGITTWSTMEDKYDGEISFPYFLTELRKTQQWTPKAGDIVEVSNSGISWFKREFITVSRNLFIVWGTHEPHSFDYCRPILPTITRAEAEVKLKTLGINVRITD